MTKRLIAILMAILLCVTLIACSKLPITQPETEGNEIGLSESTGVTSGKENDESDDTTTIHSENSTETPTLSTTTATEETVTSEKEDDETKPTEISPPKKSEETEPSLETAETAPPNVTETTKPEDITPIPHPSTQEIERLVAEYINQYRTAQGDTTATVLPGLTEVARYRARQLVSDFSHNGNPNPCTVLQYGEYIDMTLFGSDASESYYRGYNREAIGKGDWFGTADQMAQRIASGFKNSSKHWTYVGDSEYSYMAVGVHYNESDGKWYCCICMSSKNYGD